MNDIKESQDEATEVTESRSSLAGPLRKLKARRKLDLLSPVSEMAFSFENASLTTPDSAKSPTATGSSTPTTSKRTFKGEYIQSRVSTLRASN